MNKKRLIYLFTTYLAITLLALLVTTFFSTRAIRSFHLDATTTDLRARSILIKDQLLPLFNSGHWQELQQLVHKLGSHAETRITVIAADGTVAADSHEEPANLENHKERPEIILALQGRFGASSRFSTTLQKNLRYVAIPLHQDAHIIGCLRLSVPLTSLHNALTSIRLTVILSSAALALLIAFVTWYLSNQITRPILAMCDGAERFARQDFEQPIPLAGPDELVALANALNSMAHDLRHHIQTVVTQRNELETIFASMVEGVFTVDHTERFTSINQAAARLLETSQDKALGRTVLEVIRNSDLKIFLLKTLQASEPTSAEITLLHGDHNKVIIAAHGVQLPATTHPSRAMVVLHDITRIKQLENIRRDFVSNVSHELKTPITSIQGFVETLLDGALEDVEYSRQFLQIVHSQSQRLSAIIEDLLTLSRLEEKREALDLLPVNLINSVEAAILACQPTADSKEIALSFDCDQQAQAAINKPLFDLALVNLISNAIKYSPRQTQVFITVQIRADLVEVAVVDQGEGIARQHLKRLFERFYRVDKGRSRQAGGTGLGLAIVKHIVLSHHGNITVNSTVGQGSTFTIQLPALKSDNSASF